MTARGRSIRRSLWSLAAGVALAAAMLAAPAQADWLVMTDGTRVETDGPWTERGKLVVFTDKGARLIARAVSVVKGIEARYESVLGQAELKRTKASLRALADDHRKRGDRV